MAFAAPRRASSSNSVLRSLLVLAALVGLAVLLAHIGDAYADPDALWNIVRDKCLPNEREYGQPAPCALVDLDDGAERGYVVLKDIVGDTQYLVMPTAKIAGIEDLAVLAPGAANYFADAWNERHFTVEAAKAALPRDAISLAINSVAGRTQNHLHIHVDCVKPEVRDAVGRQLAAIGATWAPLAEPLAGHPYRAMRVAGDGLDGANPFILLAEGVPGARAAMGSHTLVVLGASFAGNAPGFVILDDQVDAATADRGSGEELQDHSCALARQ
jgi:CDP-diacylglycerol pyrophosphatase